MSKTKTAKTISATAAQALSNDEAQARGLLCADAVRAYADRMQKEASKKACITAAQDIAAHASLVGARLPDQWQDVVNRDSGKKLARIAKALAAGTFYGNDPEAASTKKHGSKDGSIPHFICQILDGKQTRKELIGNAHAGVEAAIAAGERYRDAAGAQVGYVRQALWLAGIVEGNVRSKGAAMTIVDKAAALSLLPPEIRARYEGKTA